MTLIRHWSLQRLYEILLVNGLIMLHLLVVW